MSVQAQPCLKESGSIARAFKQQQREKKKFTALPTHELAIKVLRHNSLAHDYHGYKCGTNQRGLI